MAILCHIIARNRQKTKMAAMTEKTQPQPWEQPSARKLPMVPISSSSQPSRPRTTKRTMPRMINPMSSMPVSYQILYKMVVVA